MASSLLAHFVCFPTQQVDVQEVSILLHLLLQQTAVKAEGMVFLQNQKVGLLDPPITGQSEIPLAIFGCRTDPFCHCYRKGGRDPWTPSWDLSVPLLPQAWA